MSINIINSSKFWTVERINAFWAEQSKFPELYFSNRYGLNITDWASQFVPPGSHVLDYGAGLGFLIPHLIRHGYIVTATDLNPPSLAAAQSFLQKSGLTGFSGTYSVDQLITEQVQFDVVMLCEVIEHLDDSSEAVVLANIHRLLKPGGRIIVTTPNEEDLVKNMVYCPECSHWFHPWQHMRSWSAGSLKSAVEKHGFNVQVSEACDFTYTSLRAFLMRGSRFIKKVLFGHSPLPHLRLVAIKINA